MKNKSSKQEFNVTKIKPSRNKIDKFFSRFKKVIYKVTTPFGDSKIGDLREAYLISNDGYKALLYHPKGSEPHSCGSFEICREKCHKDFDYFISLNEDSYVNSADYYLSKFL